MEQTKLPKLRAMFDDLAARKERILREVAPHRDNYERIMNLPELIEARRVIKECNKKLGLIENEMVALGRALGAKVMLAEGGNLIIKVGKE